MTKDLHESFYGTLDELQKVIKPNLQGLGMESLANAAYYYCKFQFGSPDFF